MSRLFYLMCMAACFLSCGKGYRIKGVSTISTINGKVVALKMVVDNEWQMIDSCEVMHGQFGMSGNSDSVMVVALFVDDKPLLPVVLEPGLIDVVISDIALRVEGTPLNDSLYNFITQVHKLELRMAELARTESRMIMDGYSIMEVEQHLDSVRLHLSTEMESLVCTFISDNYENVLSLCGFSMLCNGLPYPSITPLMQMVLNNAPASFTEHPMVSEYVRTARDNMEKYGVADIVE